jgi:hypothetical protein
MRSVAARHFNGFLLFYQYLNKKCEGLPGFIFLGFIFYRGLIYLLRMYRDLLCVSVFQRTLILALARRARPHPHYTFAITLTELSPSEILWDLFQNV